jgi:TetR/AcrR family transcriptional regulator
MGTAERKQREKELRRKQILEAAEKVFMNKGFEDATMDEIAEACELSKGTLYLYFQSKDILYFYVMLEIMEQYCDILETDLAKAENYPKRLECLGSSYLYYYDNYPARFRMLNNLDHPKYSDTDPRDFDRVLLKRASRLWDICAGVIREGIDLGYIRSDTNPLKLGLTLWGGGYGIIKIMDHALSACCPLEKKKDFEDNYGYNVHFISRSEFEEMLRNLWVAVIRSVKTDKNLVSE